MVEVKQQYTDDECIAFAMLHGAEFFKVTSGSGHDALGWYVGLSPHESVHEIEEINGNQTGSYAFETRAAIARAWCEYYKLI